MGVPTSYLARRLGSPTLDLRCRLMNSIQFNKRFESDGWPASTRLVNRLCGFIDSKSPTPAGRTLQPKSRRRV
eukprot:5320371-Prymnesium_polylepis.1